MKYKCVKCKKIVDIESKRRIRCIYCGSKILMKVRSGNVKVIKAR